MALHLQHPSHAFTRFFPPPTSSFLVSPAFFVSYTTQKQGSSEFAATILTRCHVASASDPSSYTIYVLVSLNPQSHSVDPTLGIVGHLNHSVRQLFQKPVGSGSRGQCDGITRLHKNRPSIFDPSEVQYSSPEPLRTQSIQLLLPTHTTRQPKPINPSQEESTSHRDPT